MNAVMQNDEGFSAHHKWFKIKNKKLIMSTKFYSS